MPGSRAEKYLDALLVSDPHFRKFWVRLDTMEQERYRATWEDLDAEANAGIVRLKERHVAVHLQTRKWLSVVQEHAFAHSRVPSDWVLIANDRAEQWRIYRRNRSHLVRLLDRLGLASHARIYGGLKPYQSLRRKLYNSRDDTAIRRNIVDIWDLIRFRIVTESLSQLLDLGVGLWMLRFEGIVRCRNYYFYPRGGDPADPYRALHFELQDAQGGIVELQVMTQRREAVALLDHAPVFKQTVPFADDGHREWLKCIGYVANTLDAQTLPANLTASGLFRRAVYDGRGSR